MADTVKTLTVNGREVTFTNERNLLEVIRKAGIEIPTFCYHSELSIYGACRLCLVLVEGKGIMASCSTAPAPGMVVHTDTKEIRDMRKISVPHDLELRRNIVQRLARTLENQYLKKVVIKYV